MSKTRKTRFREYVKHPRYGDKPIYSGAIVDEHQLERSHWSYCKGAFFPETAIKADVSKQNYALYPRSYYIDVEKVCRECKRYFLFFAREQKYWFEVLGFYVDADCVKCPECRAKEHKFSALIAEYENLLKIVTRSNKETELLREVALVLHEKGYIKNINKIKQIR